MSAKTLELTTESFDEKVLRSDAPVLVDFWAEWCQPCRVIGPAVDRIAERFAGEAVVGKVDVDANAPLATQYDVRAIPTLLVFRGGEVVKRLVGLQSEAALAEAIEDALHADAA